MTYSQPRTLERIDHAHDDPVADQAGFLDHRMIVVEDDAIFRLIWRRMPSEIACDTRSSPRACETTAPTSINWSINCWRVSTSVSICSAHAVKLDDHARPLRRREAANRAILVERHRRQAQRLVRLQVGEIFDVLDGQIRVVLKLAAGAAMHRPDDHRLVARAQRVDHILEVTVTAGDDVDIRRVGMPGVGDDVFRHAHVGAVLAGQIEHRVDVRHHQTARRFVGDFAPGQIDQRRQTAALSPGRISGDLDDLPVRFALPDKTLDQRIEVDDVALLVQADGDVLEVDVDRDILGLLDAEQRFQRLEDHLIGEFRAFQHVVRPPHTHARVARPLDAPHQRNQIGVGGRQDQLVDRFRVEREIVHDQRIRQAFAVRNVENLVACGLEDVLRVNARPQLSAGVLLPVRRRDRLAADPR